MGQGAELRPSNGTGPRPDLPEGYRELPKPKQPLRPLQRRAGATAGSVADIVRSKGDRIIRRMQRERVLFGLGRIISLVHCPTHGQLQEHATFCCDYASRNRHRLARNHLRCTRLGKAFQAILMGVVIVIVLQLLTGCAASGAGEERGLSTTQRLEVIQLTVDIARAELAEYLAEHPVDAEGKDQRERVLAAYDAAATVLGQAIAVYWDTGQLNKRELVWTSTDHIYQLYVALIWEQDLEPEERERKRRRATALRTLVRMLPWTE